MIVEEWVTTRGAPSTSPKGPQFPAGPLQALIRPQGEITIEDRARQLGLTDRTIQGYLSPRCRSFSLQVADRLACRLGRNLEELYPEEWREYVWEREVEYFPSGKRRAS